MRAFWKDAILVALATLAILGYVNLVENFF
jgi:hypothetical protein